MSYQSRRKYQSRRERFYAHARVYRLIYIFGLIGLVLLVLFEGRAIYDWARTYFMR